MATSFSTEQRKLQREIERLQRLQEELKRKERVPIIEKIVQDMRSFDINPDDIVQAFGSKSIRTKATSKTSTSKKSSTRRKGAIVQPKYRHPTTGATWTGRGRAPLWIVESEQAGTMRDAFLIKTAGSEGEGGIKGDEEQDLNPSGSDGQNVQ